MFDDCEWEEPIAASSLVEQIDSEGAAFGLCADFDHEMGRVFVCEIEPRVEEHAGLGGYVDDAAGRRLMCVSDNAPFNAVHANRISMDHVERPAVRYELHEQMIEDEKARKSEAHAHDFKSTMARSMRGGAIFYPHMNDALVLNRKARRIREALRKRGR